MKYMNLFRASMLVMLTVAFTGCMNEPDVLETPAVEDSDVTLRLNIDMSSFGNTRSEGHTTVDGTAAERFINFSGGDFTVAIYDNSGNFITSPTFNPSYSGDGIYILETTLEKTDVALIGNEFQIMVVANWKSYDASLSYPAAFPAAQATSAGLWTNTTQFNFSHQDYVTGTNAWTPDIQNSRFIPMFGIARARFTDSVTGAFGNNRLGVTIPMLRALAKVEIIDKTQNALITDVSLSEFNKKGRLIPNVAENPSWSGSSQVTKPSLPTLADADKGQNLKFINLPRIIDGVQRNVWTAYIPEMVLGNDMTIAPTRPRMNITAVANGSQFNYPLHFAQYDAQGVPSLPNATSWNYVLRNHIYQYEINSLNASADIVVNVLPWTLVEDIPWDYTENVIVEEGHFLDWNLETVAGVNTEEAVVTVLPDITDIAEATFMITAPLGGTWYATLLPVSGKEDAFYFVDEDGEEIPTFSGEVGKEYTVRIRNRAIKVYDVNNQMKLVFTVKTADGRWLEVDLCEGDAADFIINQNMTSY